MSADDDHPAMRSFVHHASKLAVEFNTFIVEHTFPMAAARYKALCILTNEAMLRDAGKAGRRVIADQCVRQFRILLEQELGLAAEPDEDRQAP